MIITKEYLQEQLTAIEQQYEATLVDCARYEGAANTVRALIAELDKSEVIDGKVQEQEKEVKIK